MLHYFECIFVMLYYLYIRTSMENGKVIKGPVFLKTDSSPGRFKEDIIQDEGEAVKFKAKKLRLDQYELIYIDESNVAVNDMSEMKKITI